MHLHQHSGRYLAKLQRAGMNLGHRKPRVSPLPLPLKNLRVAVKKITGGQFFTASSNQSHFKLSFGVEVLIKC